MPIGDVAPGLTAVPRNVCSALQDGGCMLYKIARFLQLAGLIIVPVAISGNLAERGGNPVLDLKESLSLATIGCFVFLCGWLLQQSSRPQ
jgi:hypothetical protein